MYGVQPMVQQQHMAQQLVHTHHMLAVTMPVLHHSELAHIRKLKALFFKKSTISGENRPISVKIEPFLAKNG